MSFRKQKSFVLKTVFHTWQMHSSRNVHNFTWMCVFAIAYALRWGVALVGEFIY